MSVTTHPVAPEEVMAFLDGELSAERAQTVSVHVAACVECQKIRDLFHSTSHSLAQWTVPAVREQMAEQVFQGSATGKSLPASPFVRDLRSFFRRRSTLAWGGVAFALLLIFIGLASMPSRQIAISRAKRDAVKTERLVFEDVAPRASRGVDVFTDAMQPAELPSEEEEQSNGARKAWTPSGPMIARTVSLAMVVKDFDAGRASLDAILARYHGYAANLTVSTPPGTARVMQASLRIPAAQLASVLGELKALGRVENETQTGEEVTEQHADLVARLKNSRETERRLQDVLRTRTGKVKDVLEVETEIARVRGEIEQMEAEQQSLEHRVAFSAIGLKLAEEYKAQLSTPAPSVLMRLRNATVNGFRSAFESLVGIALFFAESGPSLVLWAIVVGFPVWFLWRRYRRAHALASLGEA